MKAICACLLVVFLSACTTGEEETFTASADVDLTRVADTLGAIDRELGGGLDIPAMMALTTSVALDEEKQMDMAVSYKGNPTRLYFHVWREQQDWVHLYLSSPSENLISALEPKLTAHARAAAPDST